MDPGQFPVVRERVEVKEPDTEAEVRPPPKKKLAGLVKLFYDENGNLLGSQLNEPGVKDLPLTEEERARLTKQEKGFLDINREPHILNNMRQAGQMMDPKKSLIREWFRTMTFIFSVMVPHLKLEIRFLAASKYLVVWDGDQSGGRLLLPRWSRSVRCARA